MLYKAFPWSRRGFAPLLMVGAFAALLSVLYGYAPASEPHGDSTESTDLMTLQAKVSVAPSPDQLLLVVARSTIEEAFGIRVSFESNRIPYTEQDRDTVGSLFETSRGEYLGDVLNRLVNILERRQNRRYSFKEEQGSLYVYPTEDETKLAERIDLHVENVSAWDAFKAIETAINDRSEDGRYVSFWPSCLAFVGLPEVPGEEFHKNEEITLSLSNVSARDAVIGVIRESSLNMTYRYYLRWLGDSMVISIYDSEGNRLCEYAEGGIAEVREWTDSHFLMELDPDETIVVHLPEGTKTKTVGELRR